MADKFTAAQFDERAFEPTGRFGDWERLVSQAPQAALERLEPLRAALRDDFRRVASRVMALPAQACPDDLAALVVIPRAGKSGFKEQDDVLASLLGLYAMGGAYVPEHIDRVGEGSAPASPRNAVANFYFAHRKSLYAAGDTIWRLDAESLMRLSFIDVARPLEPEDRLKTNSTGESERYEVILALPQGRGALFPYSEFKSFGLSLGFEVYDKNRMVLHDVVSIIVMGPRKKLPLLAEFTLIRDIAESAAQKPLPAPGELY